MGTGRSGKIRKGEENGDDEVGLFPPSPSPPSEATKPSQARSCRSTSQPLPDTNLASDRCQKSNSRHNCSTFHRGPFIISQIASFTTLFGPACWWEPGTKWICLGIHLHVTFAMLRSLRSTLMYDKKKMMERIDRGRRTEENGK
ncbi:hypothetical protein BO82DRAFT_108527 [Aspergillus uvarum CBS 121591]|uniref:Uncharacterized protein n=1 Tax=Aspergillus uvarum CBS 121591 TaxID=1448315 RepID=A0A319C3K7_9EURO|nr:hypothetical protein BO82DRAFT_108527 [Aspergillus uvarum CBS 121591]PYH80556.1 hypothetical protein BO82DRAFT_108527 [Aspergillus uvarum CBS 121591]